MNRTFASSYRATFGRPNKTLWLAVGIVAALLTLILALPGVRGFFGLESLRAEQVLACLGASITLLMGLELAKRLWRRRLET